jgi:hypothetical protein
LLRATKGTQRVSPHRRPTRVIARIALGSALLLTLDGTAVALPAASLAATPPADTAGPAVTTPTAALDSGTPTVALRSPVTAAAAAAVTATPSTVTADSTVARTSTYTEASSVLRYSGTWSTAHSRFYAGGKAKYSRQRGATVTARFSGNRIAWVGPIGPTRGAARVYVDGHYVKTVNTYSRSFVARRTLFSRSWASSGTHTLKIVVVGTRGHPIVALDSVAIRRLVTVSSTPAPAPATSGRTVTVASIAALKSALADNSVGQIVVRNGTYRVSAAASQASNSLWIGAHYGGRSRAVLVRAESRGGVTFDGGGTGIFGCITFLQTAHDQTWDGFRCANGRASQTGVITFGGYPNLSGSPTRITLRYWSILSSARGSSTSSSAPATDHAIYISDARGAGPNHLTFDHIDVDGRGGLASAFHFFHSASGAPNASYVTIRSLHVTGTQQAIMLWDHTLRNIVIDGVSVSGALRFGVRYEAEGASGMVIRNVRTAGSGSRGWYSSMGAHPSGVTMSGNIFD